MPQKSGGMDITMKYTAVLFDLDGTLLDTLNDLAASANHALNNMRFPLRTKEEIRSFVGNGIEMLLRQCAPSNCDEKTFQQLHTLFKEHYARHHTDHTLPYPGILPMLNKLRAEDYKTAVISNKRDDAVQSLCNTFLPGCFDTTLGETEVFARKPAPDMLKEVMKRLCVSSESCLYIGDSEVDVYTAQNAGTDFLGVGWGFRTREQLIDAGAEHIISSPEELVSFLAK